MDIFEQLEVVFSERRSEALKQSSKFREYTLKESELYTKLKESMSNDQQKLFEGYLMPHLLHISIFHALECIGRHALFVYQMIKCYGEGFTGGGEAPFLYDRITE